MLLAAAASSPRSLRLRRASRAGATQTPPPLCTHARCSSPRLGSLRALKATLDVLQERDASEQTTPGSVSVIQLTKAQIAQRDN